MEEINFSEREYPDIENPPNFVHSNSNYIGKIDFHGNILYEVRLDIEG